MSKAPTWRACPNDCGRLFSAVLAPAPYYVAAWRCDGCGAEIKHKPQKFFAAADLTAGKSHEQ